MIDYEERKRMVKGWRGRRLLACRAADVFEEVIQELGSDNGKDCPPSGGIPDVSAALRAEMANAVANLLRLTLLMNDGNISPQKLNRF